MDDIDKSDEKAEVINDAMLKDAHLAAQADNVPFIEGDCEKCEEPSLRLVRCTDKIEGDIWACARCRDKYKLPTRRV